MIYHNSATAMLDLTPDGVIPPLTNCDPNRRRYTERDVQEAAQELLVAAGVIMIMAINLRWHRSAPRLSARVIQHAVDQAKNWSQKSGYTEALRNFERAKSGAYIVAV